MDSIRPIRALVRGLEALTVLNLRDGATVSEVAREIRLPRTTAYRILETLCDSGFAFRDAAAERYRLTIRVRDLSAGFEDESWVTQNVKPHLFELGESVVWPVHFATLCGCQLMIREATDHSSPLAIERYSAGMPLPLLTTATGRIYLTYCADAQSSALLNSLRRSKKDEDRLARQPVQLRELLAETRTLGYATAVRARGLVEELSISVPVAAPDHAVGALTVRFAASAVPLKSGLERFLPKLRQCAAKIGAMRSGAPQTAAQGDL